MIQQNRGGPVAREPGYCTNKQLSYYAIVPADMLDRENTVIDELIGFALDTLGARHLDVRVYNETATHAPHTPVAENFEYYLPTTARKSCGNPPLERIASILPQ